TPSPTYTPFPYTTLFRSCSTPLDIQHGRLGVAGEETAFPAIVWRERRRVVVAGLDAFTASPEHLLVLHGVQRVYGRLGIDLADRSEEHTSELQSRFDLVC